MVAFWRIGWDERRREEVSVESMRAVELMMSRCGDFDLVLEYVLEYGGRDGRIVQMLRLWQ